MPSASGVFLLATSMVFSNSASASSTLVEKGLTLAMVDVAAYCVVVSRTDETFGRIEIFFPPVKGLATLIFKKRGIPQCTPSCTRFRAKVDGGTQRLPAHSNARFAYRNARLEHRSYLSKCSPGEYCFQIRTQTRMHHSTLRRKSKSGYDKSSHG